MSASPIARQAAMTIPSRKVLIHDASDLPDLYSSTPGGTLYSTTPGGNLIAQIQSRARKKKLIKTQGREEEEEDGIQICPSGEVLKVTTQ